MRILFGAADRDLLQCYAKLLSDGERSVDTSFDGAQVLRKLTQQRYDLLIVSDTIPRVSVSRILAQCGKDGLLSIVLLSEPVCARRLLQTPTANAYLALPFLPEELGALIDSVVQKRANALVLQFEGFAVYPAEFSLETLPVTAGELDVLAALCEGAPIKDEKYGVYIASLNARLAQLGLRHRIRYRKNIGYGMVNENE